jgi:alpha-tubulin suppressor-like RCC1 family protein
LVLGRWFAISTRASCHGEISTQLSSSAIQQGLRRKTTIRIAAGGYHSFAIDDKDSVWAWGLNNYGQTGIRTNAGEDGAVVEKPTFVKSLAHEFVTEIAGGTHPSVACTEYGGLLIWGRCDDGQAGVPMDWLSDDDVVEGKILLHPKEVYGKLFVCRSLNYRVLGNESRRQDSQCSGWHR